MAACGSLQHIFKNPLPENPTLLESLSSWNQINPTKPIEDSSFTEIFGELHFKENQESLPSSTLPDLSSSSPSSSSSLIHLTPQIRVKNLDEEKSFSSNNNGGSAKNPSSDFSSSIDRKSYDKNSDSSSSMNSESLQLCTEGLGFESSGDVEDLKTDMNDDWQNIEERMRIARHAPPHENLYGELRRPSRTSGGGAFPPPISCIGESGKPWVCFKSYRQDGRFVLKKIRIPTPEFLHASREDGRLKLQLFQSEDEIVEDDDDEEEENEEQYEDDDESDEIDGNE